MASENFVRYFHRFLLTLNYIAMLNVNVFLFLSRKCWLHLAWQYNLKSKENDGSIWQNFQKPLLHLNCVKNFRSSKRWFDLVKVLPLLDQMTSEVQGNFGMTDIYERKWVKLFRNCTWWSITKLMIFILIWNLRYCHFEKKISLSHHHHHLCHILHVMMSLLSS
jgi:hypothetical protein